MKPINAAVEWAIRRPYAAAVLGLASVLLLLHVTGTNADTLPEPSPSGSTAALLVPPPASSAPVPAPALTPTATAAPTPAPAAALDVATRFIRAYLNRRLTPAARDAALTPVATAAYRARLRHAGPVTLPDPAAKPSIRVLATDENGARVAVTVGRAVLLLALTPVEGPLRVDDVTPTIPAG